MSTKYTPPRPEKIEVNLFDPKAMIKALEAGAEALTRDDDGRKSADFAGKLNGLRGQLERHVWANEWVEFETPLGTFAVNRLKQMKLNGKPMQEGTHTITINVAILAERAFPND